MAPSKVYNHYVIAHDYKRRPGNLLGAILSHVVLRTVSLRDVNSWICIVLYFFLGRKEPSPQLNEHLWTQVIKHLNVHIYLVTCWRIVA